MQWMTMDGFVTWTEESAKCRPARLGHLGEGNAERTNCIQAESLDGYGGDTAIDVWGR